MRSGFCDIVLRAVDKVGKQHGAAFDMAQEAGADACALGRAFDEPGNVGEHEAGADAERDDAEVGNQRRERIVGELWVSRR